MSILVNTETGEVVRRGDHLTTFRGELFIVDSHIDPRHEGSTGRIYGKLYDTEEGHMTLLYPSVCKCKIVGHEYEAA